MRLGWKLLFAMTALVAGCTALLDLDRLRDGEGADARVPDLGDLGVPDLTGADLAGADLSTLDLSRVCPTFPASLSFSSTSIPVAHLSTLGQGDLDEDGRPDLVVGTNATTTQVQVMIGNGTSFTPHLPVDGGCTGANYLVGTYVGRFRGGAHLDVLVTCEDLNGSQAPEMFLLEGDGKGGLGPPKSFSGPRPIDRATVADVDGDGADDLVSLPSDYAGVAIYWGAPTLQSAPPTLLLTAGDAAGVAVGVIVPGQRPSIAVAHIDGSTGDMAVDASRVVLFRPQPGTVRDFTTPLTIPSTGQAANGIVLGRFDGDGYLDALVTTNDGPLLFLAGAADGSLAAPAIANSAPMHQQRPLAVDLNCDGIDDIALTHFQTFTGPTSTWDKTSIFVGTGVGTLTSVALPSAAFPDGPAPGTVVSGDYNGDGRADLVVAESQGATGFLRVLTSAAP